MTVGAHKIRLMAEKGLAATAEPDVAQAEEKPAAECST
jgi:hypothetical protein